ncbi:MAG: hypothetical protein CL920_31795 [Deltaproteobacteria bacterium]|nr:hypothetical protein [Deltaproteobacteria bacterium]MBU53303.1 hypothetical protein [Deltaproteobacteria bacterium]
MDGESTTPSEARQQKGQAKRGSNRGKWQLAQKSGSKKGQVATCPKKRQQQAQVEMWKTEETTCPSTEGKKSVVMGEEE